MRLNFKQRLERSPQLKDFKNWPVITLDNVDRSKRKGFKKNQCVVKMVLAGNRYEDIEKRTGIPPSRISIIMKRALAGDEEVDPPLTGSLIPRRFIKTPIRKAPLSKIDNPAGAKSSFTYLLQTVPKLKENLDFILEKDLRDDEYGENLTPASFHEAFKLFLVYANHPTDSYPYTEDFLAYESTRIYFHRRRAEIKMKKLSSSGSSMHSGEKLFLFGREVQLDEYTYDAHSTVYLEFMGQKIPIRLARFTLIVLSDVDTECSLSYHLALNKQCSQYDILTLLENACIFTQPRKLMSPGIAIPPAPHFPNNISEEFSRVAFNTVAIDNALSHLAENVENYICDTHKGTVSLGYGGTPRTRNIIEHAFDILSDQAKRFKSTSGKNPNDPIKESRKNSKKPPVPTLETIDEVIYAILASGNNKPRAHLMTNTPLELCQHMKHQSLIRILPQVVVEKRNAFELTKRVPVKWLKDEGRNPHINFYGCRYQGVCLHNIDLVEKDIEVKYDYRDIRKLKAYTLEGEYIGDIFAPKTWQKFSHGVKTRQYINKFCRRYKVHMKDPLTEFFWLQVNRKNKSRSALEMVRLYQEYIAFQPLLDPSNKVVNEDTKTIANQVDKPFPITSSKIPKWSPEIAHAYRNK